MGAINSDQKRYLGYRRVALLVLAFTITACASTGPTSTPARIEIQQDVGFTITEKLRINSNVRTEYQEALSLIAQGHPDRGIAILEAVVEAAPHLNATRIDLGIAHHRVNNLKKAEDNLLLALEMTPNHPIAHNELGIVYRKTGRFAQARQSYQAALAIYPGYHYARRNLAVLCDLYLADPECALENFEAYMTTVPSDDEASMWIADIRMRMGQSEE